MKSPLTDFREEFRSRTLELIWRQWTALGVFGHIPPQKGMIIDPEALLLVSCTMGRHDPRLFDSILDWLRINARYLNVQRMQRMLKEYHFSGGAVYSAVAASVNTTEHQAKWSRSVHLVREAAVLEEPLFFMANGDPLPVMREPDQIFRAHGFLRDPYTPRDTARVFRAELAANLLLRLRAFLGVNARCEILAYLLLNGRGSPRAVARACGYYPATVTKALTEMGDSGYLASRSEGRHRYYMLVSDAWCELLVGQDRPTWINWIPLFRTLEQTWSFLHAEERYAQNPLAQASDLRRLLTASLIDLLSASGLRIVVDNYSRYAGEALLPHFTALMRDVFDAIVRNA